MRSRRVCVDNVDKRRLQRRTTNQEAVNVGLLGKLAAVLLVDAAAVQDARLLRRLGRDLLLQPLADRGVDFLRLLCGGDLAGANGPGVRVSQVEMQCANGDSPDGLVGDDNLAPVVDLVRNSLELLGDDVNSGAGLPLLEALAAAQNNADAAVERGLGLAGHERVVLVQDGAALRVAEDGPCDAAILELLGGDLTGEGTVGLVVDVLRGDLNVLAQLLAGWEEVERGGSNDDLCRAVSMSIEAYPRATHQRSGRA